jgi:hypothetical protein
MIYARVTYICTHSPDRLCIHKHTLINLIINSDINQRRQRPNGKVTDSNIEKLF